MIHETLAMPCSYNKTAFHKVAELKCNVFSKAVLLMVVEAVFEAERISPHDLPHDLACTHGLRPKDAEYLLPELILAENHFHSITRMRPRPINVTTTMDTTSTNILSRTSFMNAE
jgi:hypothetical protein